MLARISAAAEDVYESFVGMHAIGIARIDPNKNLDDFRKALSGLLVRYADSALRERVRRRTPSGGPTSRVSACFVGTAFAGQLLASLGCAKRNPAEARAKRERRLAERVGFEPTVEFPLHTLSKRA